MKLNLRVIGALGDALPKQVGSLLIIALFIGNPSQCIQDRRIGWCIRAGLLRELTCALEVIEFLCIDIGQVVQCQNKGWVRRDNLFISIPRFVELLHLAVDHAGNEQGR